MQAFGAPQFSDDASLLPPISTAHLNAALIADARVVVLIVLDGYGILMSGDGATLRASAPDGLLACSSLTSVFPSTTAAALTSIQTGLSPGQHGVAGYTLFLPEVRKVVNMIQFSAVDGSSLPSRAVDPAAMLPIPSIYDRLKSQGIESVVVSHAEYARSPLTILHSGDTPYRGHRTAAEFALMLQREARRPGRRFVFGYWAGIDTLAHAYGPSSAEVALEIALTEQALATGFLRPLARGSDDVVVIVAADHGLTDIPEAKAESLASLAKTAGKFSRPPTGERRAAGLSMTGAAHRDRLVQHVGDRGIVLDTSDATKAGLFGPQPRHPDLIARIGDSLLLARKDYSFPFRPLPDSGTHSLGAHGSLTPSEMLVPLLIWRFGRQSSTMEHGSSAVEPAAASHSAAADKAS